MKTQFSDEQLQQLVRQSWPAYPERNPGFRAAVWARIEAGHRLPVTWGAWLKQHLPSVAAYAAAVVLVAGASGGLLASRQVERDRETQIQRYVASIDPHQRVSAVTTP